MKVINSIINTDEISSEIDLVSSLEVSDEVKDRIKDEVGSYIMEQTLLAVGSAKSPVSGEAWKKSLNPLYAKEKSNEGGTPIANLEMHGDMLQSFGFEKTDDGIKIGVFGAEASKADGHNNFSGDSELPQRRFIPEEGQDYKRDIAKGAQEIINDIMAEEVSIDETELADIETKSDLYDLLSGVFGTTNRQVIQRAVIGSEKITDILSKYELMDLL